LNIQKFKQILKEFLSIEGASHCDLYDQKDIIPFDKIEEFIRKNLK